MLAVGDQVRYERDFDDEHLIDEGRVEMCDALTNRFVIVSFPEGDLGGRQWIYFGNHELNADGHKVENLAKLADPFEGTDVPDDYEGTRPAVGRD